MFKRVEKRRKKKEEEEELDLDEDMKQVLGLHDTDSEESNSDSDDHQSPADDDDESEPFDLDGSNADISEGEGSVLDSEGDEKPRITVQEALRDPLYIVSVQPLVKACLLCPGKLLKSTTMMELHRKSNAHERRKKQFDTEALTADPKDNSWDILDQLAHKSPKAALTSSGTSKRAEKRKAYATKRKARRDNHKTKVKVKKAKNPATEEPTKQPPPKKQRVQFPISTSPKKTTLPPKEPKVVEDQTGTRGIIASVSKTAKVVRARAGHGTPAVKERPKAVKHLTAVP